MGSRNQGTPPAERMNLAVSGLNLLLTAGLLATAFWGLKGTARQIERAAMQIEGATLYQVARDGRELTQSARNGEVAPEDLLSYFHATFLLFEREVIDSDGWVPIKRAYCFFIQGSEPARAYLGKYRDRYDDEFIDFSARFEGGEECV